MKAGLFAILFFLGFFAAGAFALDTCPQTLDFGNAVSNVFQYSNSGNFCGMYPNQSIAVYSTGSPFLKLTMTKSYGGVLQSDLDSEAWSFRSDLLNKSNSTVETYAFNIFEWKDERADLMAQTTNSKGAVSGTRNLFGVSEADKPKLAGQLVDGQLAGGTYARLNVPNSKSYIDVKFKMDSFWLYSGGTINELKITASPDIETVIKELNAGGVEPPKPTSCDSITDCMVNVNKKLLSGIFK